MYLRPPYSGNDMNNDYNPPVENVWSLISNKVKNLYFKQAINRCRKVQYEDIFNEVEADEEFCDTLY